MAENPFDFEPHTDEEKAELEKARAERPAARWERAEEKRREELEQRRADAEDPVKQREEWDRQRGAALARGRNREAGAIMIFFGFCIVAGSVPLSIVLPGSFITWGVRLAGVVIVLHGFKKLLTGSAD